MREDARYWILEGKKALNRAQKCMDEAIEMLPDEEDE